MHVKRLKINLNWDININMTSWLCIAPFRYQEWGFSPSQIRHKRRSVHFIGKFKIWNLFTSTLFIADCFIPSQPRFPHTKGIEDETVGD